MMMHRSLLSLLIFLSFLNTCIGTEIKWKEGEEGGNMPYSQNIRNKMLELEKVIMSSPNPQQTLIKIAQDNNMTPEQLVGLIQESKGGSAQQQQQRGPAVLSTIIQTFTSILVLIYKFALAKPRQFALLSGLVWILLHCIISYPKNGIVFSTKPVFLISHGHSTIFQPPSSYLQDYVHSLDESPEYSFPHTKDLLKHVIDYDEDSPVLKGSEANKHHMKVIIHSSDSISISEHDNDLLVTSASQVLSSHRFTEFCSNGVVCTSHDDYLVFALQNLGDYYRYGIQSFHLVHDYEDQDDDGSYTKTMIFGTVIHGHLDGYLRFTIKLTDEVTVSTTYFQPKKSRNAFKSIQKLLPELTSSILQTIQMEYKQKIARGSFSKRYKKTMQDSYHSKKKRQAKELKELEDMVRERKKRWSNPNAGHFRPSGKRMISPNHC